MLEGQVTFHVAGDDIPAAAGTVVHIPRMTPYTFTVNNAETRVLNWYAPTGAEMHVISLARPAEERRRPTFEEGRPPKSDEQNQILSRLYGSVAVEALLFSVMPSAERPPPGAGRSATRMSRLPKTWLLTSPSGRNGAFSHGRPAQMASTTSRKLRCQAPPNCRVAR